MFKRILAWAVVILIVFAAIRGFGLQAEFGKFSAVLSILGHTLALTIAAMWFFRGPRDGFWPTFRGLLPRIWVVEFLTYCAVEIAVGFELSFELLQYCFFNAAPQGVVLSLLLAFALPTLWGRESEELATD